MKSGLGRVTEGTEQYQGVVVYSMSDLPLVSINIVLLTSPSEYYRTYIRVWLVFARVLVSIL